MTVRELIETNFNYEMMDESGELFQVQIFDSKSDKFTRECPAKTILESSFADKTVKRWFSCADGIDGGKYYVQITLNIQI